MTESKEQKMKKEKDMENTMQLIQEYLTKQDEVKKLHEKLTNKVLRKALDILLWENENIGTDHDVERDGIRYLYDLVFKENYVLLNADKEWSYLTYDNDSYIIPYKKLFSDDWKEKALSDHKEKLTTEEKQQAKIEEKK